MGLFDLPVRLLLWIDALLAVVAPWAWLRLVIWSAIAAALTMGLYWLISPQARIGQCKRELAEAKAALDAYDGEFEGAWPLMRAMLGQAFRQIGLVLGPVLVAAIPVLCILAWLSTWYGHHYPAPGNEVSVTAVPDRFPARLEAPDGAARSNTGAQNPPRLIVSDAQGRTLHSLEVAAPVSTVHKRSWWNWLFGNPAGYLPDDSPVERVEIGFPENEFLHIGPGWMRGWEFLFILVMTACAFAIKSAFRIH